MNFETNIIGALMLDNEVIETVRGIVEPHQFESLDLGEAYRCILDLTDRSAPADVFSVGDALLSDKYKTGLGLTELADIGDCTASAVNVDYYAKQVFDGFLKRRVQSISGLAAEADTGADAVEIAIAELTKIGCVDSETSAHVNDALMETMAEIEDIFEDRIQYVKSGITTLDEMINGFTGDKLYVIAGRPAMGKSVLGINIATKAAQDGIPTKIYSLEMSKAEVSYRMVCAAGNLNTRAKNNMQESDWPKLTAGFSIIKDLPIEIDDGTGYTNSYLKNSIRTHAKKYGAGLYVIDYLQLIAINGDNRVSGIGEITRELKGLSKEINAPIILLSQLNRGLESRPCKRPLNSDLRESGEIEQDADVILMLYRDEVYNDNSDAKGVVEIIARKNRQGEMGTAYAASKLEFSRFDNLTAQV